MKGIIMAGGFGTRLRPLTFNRPKPMLPLLNRPMMKHIVDLLAAHKITDTTAVLYYLPETIKNYFGDGSGFGANMSYVMAQEDLGTAGSVKNAYTELEMNDTILVISADVLTNFDLTAALEFHRKKGALATILLTRVENPLAFGIVIVDENGKIQRFLEKPAWEQVFSDTVNTGIYILEPEAMEWIPSGEEFDFSKNLFPALLKAEKPLYGYIADGYWRDVGNLMQYRRANADVLQGTIELKIPGERRMIGDTVVYAEAGAVVEDGVVFDGTVLIGKNSSIRAGAYLKDSVVGNETVIGERCSIDGTIIWENTEIGAKSHIVHSTIASGVKVGDNSIILEHGVVSENVRMGKRVRIAAGVKIWPEKVIDDRAFVTESFIWGDRLSGELFVASRVSGTVNRDISPEFASKLGAALGAKVGRGKRIMVSSDADRGSQLIGRAFISGVLSAGVSVEDIGVLPIPVIRQELHRLHKESLSSDGTHIYAAGVHIRKSPIRKEGADFIFLEGNGSDMPTPLCRGIERIFSMEDIPRVPYNKLGILTHSRYASESYRTRLLASIEQDVIAKSDIKVVLDYSCGGAVDVLQPILSELGVQSIPINAFVDTAHFTKTRRQLSHSLSELGTVVRSLHSDVGFMIGPSGERLSLVDRDGVPFSFQEELYSITKLLLATGKTRAAAFPVSATMAVSMLLRDAGVREIRTGEDHLSMMKAALSGDIDFIGGTRGGFIFTEFSFASDAIYTTVKILEMLGKSGLRLDSIRREMPRFVMRIAEVKCPWHRKGQVMRSLIEHTESKPRDIVDGVRVITADAWVLLLPSPEKPLFTITVEAKNAAIAEQMIAEYSELIEKWQQN